MTIATATTTKFVVLAFVQGNWHKVGYITHNKRFTLDTASKKNFASENRQRLLESCKYLLEENLAKSVEWRMVGGTLARTHKLSNSDSQA